MPHREPYKKASEVPPKFGKELRQLTADNPNQQKRMDDIEPLIAERLGVLKQFIELRRKGSIEQAAKAIQLGEGKKLMDSLRHLAEQMDREERDLLKQRAGEENAPSSASQPTII